MREAHPAEGKSLPCCFCKHQFQKTLAVDTTKCLPLLQICVADSLSSTGSDNGSGPGRRSPDHKDLAIINVNGNANGHKGGQQPPGPRTSGQGSEESSSAEK